MHVADRNEQVRTPQRTAEEHICKGAALNQTDQHTKRTARLNAWHEKPAKRVRVRPRRVTPRRRWITLPNLIFPARRRIPPAPRPSRNPQPRAPRLPRHRTMDAVQADPGRVRTSTQDAIARGAGTRVQERQRGSYGGGSRRSSCWSLALRACRAQGVQRSGVSARPGTIAMPMLPRCRGPVVRRCEQRVQVTGRWPAGGVYFAFTGVPRRQI
ncbi:hypothetical protein C2E23DRAFT_224702 [Lenzites betulinus]|nr:hypothetical protein C2E23DRAFT_224702 [Lenzites betulinus]